MTNTDWTLWQGIRRALLWLVLASSLSLAWAIPLYFAVPAIEWIGNHLVGGALAMSGAVVALSTALWLVAYPVGAALSHRLNERLGVDGMLPPVLGITFGCAVAAIGYALVIPRFPDPTWLTRLVLPGMALQTAIVVAWRTWINPPD